MSQARDENVTRETRRQVDQLHKLGWYHSLELPDGRTIPGLQSTEMLQTRLSRFPIPQDLHGKRVLDIGAWDGWFSFEMERRGATVVAIDSAPSTNFLLAKELLSSAVDYQVLDICKVKPADLGTFDVVLFLGVLYHLKHPLLALEVVCELTRDLACIESYVTDNGESAGKIPVMEFYEGTELRGQFDNWVGPNTECLLAFARTAGFPVVRLEGVYEQRAHVSCWRNWQDIEGLGPAPSLIGVENSITRDHQFHRNNDEYVSLWFKSERDTLNCDEVFVQVGEFGSRPVFISRTGENGWLANCKLPPGLARGYHEVRLRLAGSRFSNALRIPVDSPGEAPVRAGAPEDTGPIAIQVVTDGKSWEPWRVRVGPGSCLSAWVAGIPDSVAPGSIVVRLDNANLAVAFLSDTDPAGLKQINAFLPAGLSTGSAVVRIVMGEIQSEPVHIQLFAP